MYHYLEVQLGQKNGFYDGNNSHTVRWHITPMIMDTYPLAKWSSALE